jgi:hypothetical protein
MNIESRLRNSVPGVTPIRAELLTELAARRRAVRRRMRFISGSALAAAIAIAAALMFPTAREPRPVAVRVGTGTGVSAVPSGDAHYRLELSQLERLTRVAPGVGLSLYHGSVYVTGSAVSNSAGTPTPTLLYRIDATDGKVLAKREIGLAESNLSPPAVVDGILWVAGSRGFLGLDPTSLQLERSINLPEPITSFAASQRQGQLWAVAGGQLVKVDATSGIARVVRCVSKPTSVAADPQGSLVAVAGGQSTVVVLSPATQRVVTRYVVSPGGPVSLAEIVDGVVWGVVGGGQFNTVFGVSVHDGRRVSLRGLGQGGGTGGGLEWSGDALVATTNGGPSWCIDPRTGQAIARITFVPDRTVLALGVAAGWAYLGLESPTRGELERGHVPACSVAESAAGGRP